MLGQAQGFVEFALAAFEFDATHDLGFRRQLGQHILLASAQKQRRNTADQAFAFLYVAMLLDRRAEEFREALVVAEQAGFDRIELGPQLAEMVLQRRTGHREALASLQLAHYLRGLALRVLDRLRLVEHEHRIVVFDQSVAVAQQQRVGGDHQIMTRYLRVQARARRTVHNEHGKIRHEACGLVMPVRDQAGRRNYQSGLIETTAMLFGEQMREYLDGLAEAHVVGQDATEAGVGEKPKPGEAVALVAAQGRTKTFGLQRRFARRALAFEFGAQPLTAEPRPLHALREFVEHAGLGATQAQRAIVF